MQIVAYPSATRIGVARSASGLAPRELHPSSPPLPARLLRACAQVKEPDTPRACRALQAPGTDEATVAEPIAEITKRDVLDVLDAMDRRGSPGAAKRALFYLRRFFKWCAEREIISHPPTFNVAAPHPEVARDRVLSIQELRNVLQALEQDASQFASLVRVLILTGQRRGEVSGMRWGEIVDLYGHDPRWEIPGQRTKNKRAHIVPLSPQVCGVLMALPRTSELVFTTTGANPFSGFGKAKARLDERIGELRAAEGLGQMAPWTLHDLRRTMVTEMNERHGIAPHIVEAVVNHVSGLAKAGVAGVYNRALYLSERRRALTAWGAFLEDLVV